jgi:protein-S-isoprenylcysteine O-methyltransferase Ste14
MKWIIIVIVLILAIALIAFLVIRNQKDEKELEKKLNSDFTTYENEERDIETREPNDEEV